MSREHPLILAVDTATPCSSVALTAGDIHDGELLATLSLNAKVTHSRRLLTGIDWLLAENSLEISDIDALAVGLGPGSFTGLRIGMATMKGLAAAMDKPLLGVSTLDGLALCCTGELPLCAMLDARKKEVYRCWYTKDGRGMYRARGSIQALGPEALVAEITEPSLLVGDGVLTYGSYLQEKAGRLVTMAPLPLSYPNATAIGFLCCEQLKGNKSMDLESAVPLYVRASDAELSLLQRENRKK